MPENTFNPELQHMYYCIIQKAIYKDKLLSTNIPEFIQGLLNPPKIIMENAKQYINEIKELFPLESKVDKKYTFKYYIIIITICFFSLTM